MASFRLTILLTDTVPRKNLLGGGTKHLIISILYRVAWCLLIAGAGNLIARSYRNAHEN